ncbi:GGDEF domain-containing protein [Photobacterium sp. GJ3]|uniref:GGDEF domain-containing protein n=1 Tax=Photobacterium sp. GJ3 TaxID=2829502 RepID=UPI001B8BC21C|nr:GGDEF domain-containing protein [Photobacterium sp. GJ3]QUJ66886.1 GGDEF domain-containing protein [Photobacterium sp. GJ3]
MDPIFWQKSQADAVPTRTKPLGADQRLLILQKLQGKPELSTLLEVFAMEVEKQVDVSRMLWRQETTTTLIRHGPGTENRQCFLLRYSDHPLGELQYDTPYALDQDEINLLHTYHRLLAGPLFSAMEYRRVKEMAMRDHLSSLRNRSCLDQDILHAIAMSERRQVGLVLLLFDLDNFKQVNDKYGHLDGDNVIRRFAAILKQSVRTSDRCYRLGGDEFVLLLQPASEQSARKVIHRVLTRMEQDHTLRTLEIGTSIGASQYCRGDSPTSLLERADRQLYQHKRSK